MSDKKFINRLKDYIDYKGISLNQFDKNIGASNGYIGKQIKNNASIGSDIIEKIISLYPDLSLRWLFTGEGNMLNKSLIEARNRIVELAKEPTVALKKKDLSDLNEFCKDRQEIIDELKRTIEILRLQLTDTIKDKELYRKILENKFDLNKQAV